MGCLPLADLHHFCLTKRFPKTPSAIYLANWNAICILHWSDCAWLCCLLSQFWLFGDQKHCVFRPITWYDKSRTTESIPGLYYWDRLLLWSQLRTGDRVGSVQLALTALSEWQFSWKKKEKKGLKSSLLIFEWFRRLCFKIFINWRSSFRWYVIRWKVMIWYLTVRDWRKEYSMKFWITIYSVIFTFELVY